MKYGHETPNTRAEGLAEILTEVAKYHVNEIADDEPQYVRDKALRLMARQILREVPAR